MSEVLIVDDEESICWGLHRLLTGEGHAVNVASSAEEALARLPLAKPDLIVLDVRLPGIDGLTAMDRFRQAAGPVPIVVITAFGNLTTAVSALRQGAFDYLPKPFDLDHAATVIERALASAPKPIDELDSDPALDDELFGSSPAMQEVFKRIALVAPSDTAVLISGESGTGKELVARAIHRHSSRAEAPLVPVNLASLSPTLVESELFGHVRGAFTGATVARQGLLELADGATVLFDEAGDIPLGAQVKLLRVLEQHEVTPVGDTRARRTRFRVIAATNRDLRRDCAEGRFRQDLFFRLAVFEINLPPLRERREEIPHLAERFLRRLSGVRASMPRLLPETVAELCRRDWPGNVRELRNAIEHGALMAPGGAIAPEHLPPSVSLAAHEQNSMGGLQEAVTQWARRHVAAPGPQSNVYHEFLAATEPALFDVALAATGHNRAKAAELLGIHRATLRKKLVSEGSGDHETQ